MKEQFVTYEIALKLKELGFDEPCFGYYKPIKSWMISTNPKYNSEPHFTGPNWCNADMSFYFMYKANSFGDRTESVKNSQFTKAVENITTPLWQQVIDWFREKHSIVITIYDNTLEKKYAFLIGKEFENKIIYASGKWLAGWSKGNTYYATYFEANKQAILKAIEIVKSK